jgi:rare lipoprotein A
LREINVMEMFARPASPRGTSGLVPAVILRALIVVFACVVGGACATAQVAPTPTAEKRKKKRAKPKPAPDEPIVVEGPGEEETPDGPPPEGEYPWEEGMASFYADSLAGNKTASGERYRIDRRTCAHRTLPFGTVLEITAPSTGQSTTCRVNDRGPFAKQRVLDVSKKCARELGMVDAGVLRVRFRQAHDSGDPG